MAGYRTKKMVVFDIDGVLSNSEVPLRHIVGKDKPDWEAFNSSLHLATLNEWARTLLNLISKNTLIFIITGRCNSTRKVTEEWLETHKINYDFLEMRPVNQYGDSAGLKRDVYRNKIKGKFDVLYAVDDTPSIIKMWEEEGIKCIPIYNPLVYVD